MSIAAIIGETVKLIEKDIEGYDDCKAIAGACPFHDDNGETMRVRDDAGIFFCVECGAGGDAIHFLKITRGMSFDEARAYVEEVEIARRARQ